jgi:hypothetical protein
VTTSVFLSRSWNVTCRAAGEHLFAANASVSISAGQQATGPDPSNNSGSASSVTVIS